MTQETRVCRFCLESKETKKNPLLEPCDCKGSIQFVHERCLTRWRRMDPLRNADICLICLTPYFLLHPGTLETIPNERTIPHFLLRFPIGLWFTVNYGFLLQVSFLQKGDLFQFFEAYQYLFQVMYFLLFWKCWNVRNKALYWKGWSDVSTTFLILCHVASNGFLHHEHFMAIVPLNLVFALYWQKHLRILQRINSL